MFSPICEAKMKEGRRQGEREEWKEEGRKKGREGRRRKGKKTWIFLLKKDDQIICNHTSEHLYQTHETVYKLFNSPC